MNSQDTTAIAAEVAKLDALRAKLNAGPLTPEDQEKAITELAGVSTRLKAVGNEPKPRQ